MATMIIAEKAKAAESIAESLGNVQKLKPSKRITVYYVQNEDLYVIPLRGHIQQYENTAPYKKWTDKDPREIITNPKAIEKHSNKYAGPYISALQKYAKICDTAIIGTDADVEGCNIGMMDALPFVKSVKPNIKIQQLWLNDLQKSSVIKGYKNLIQPKWSWAYSAEARALIDAIIGFSATREVTLTLNPILKQINTKFASIGRVQTCLLYLLYLREQLIRDFKPQPFWKILCDVSLFQQNLTASHLKNNFSDKVMAQTIFNKIKNEKYAIIKDIRQNQKQIPLPKPLNTSSALQLLTKHTKMNSKVALKTLEDLYLDKIISYPRTDSNRYSDDYDHKSIISKYLTNTKYNQHAKNLILNNKIYPNQGNKDAGDHSPITPLESLEDNSSKLKTVFHKQAYTIITQHYLSLFSEPAIELDLKVLLLVQEEPFMIKLKGILKDGFYAIAPFYKKKYDLQQELSNQEVLSLTNSKVPINKMLNEEKQTIPPPRYSDTLLLKIMEKQNLGTKSTRPAIIQILLDRNYSIRRGKVFFVTELGYLLIDALLDVWGSFLKPDFTAKVEKLLQDIKENKTNMKTVVDTIRDEFLKLFDQFRNQKALIVKKMEKLKQNGNTINVKQKNQSINKQKGFNKSYPISSANCPKCNISKMKLIKSKKKASNFLVCEDEKCKTYLSLPKKGSMKLLKSPCRKCNFNIVKISSRKAKKKFDYYICPKCWNAGLKNNINGMGFCSNCKEYKINRGRCIEVSPP